MCRSVCGKDHKLSTFAYMDRVRQKLASDLPEVSTYFQTGGLVDSVVNQGMPAPIDIQVSGNNQQAAYAVASEMARKLRSMNDVSDVLIPQDLDYPGLQLNVRREMAARLGLTASDVVNNVVTALTSNGMIAPSYWVDPHNGNNYFLTVQYTNQQIGSMTMEDFKQIPLHAPDNDQPHHAGERSRHQDDQHAHRGRSLPTLPRDRCLRFAQGRGPGRAVQRGGKDHQGHQAAAQHTRRDARLGGVDAPVVLELRRRTAAGHRARLPHPDGTVRVVHRSRSSFCWPFRPASPA